MIKVGDKVRVRSLTVPKGYSFTYDYGIGCIGTVIEADDDKKYRGILVEFNSDSPFGREHYYEDDLDLIEENKIKNIILNPYDGLTSVLKQIEDKINEVINYIKKEQRFWTK